MNINCRKYDHHRNNLGFTLVEILVVMAIIAMLAALVGPKLFGKLGQSKTKAAKAQIELLGQGLDQYRLDVGYYPTTAQGLQALIVNPGEQKWDGPYLKKNVLPKDPWDRDYNYSSPGTHGEYDIWSYGRDGAQGGEGEDSDIVSWQ
jgi:general secretion pathway protein G